MSKDYIAKPTKKRAAGFNTEVKVLAVLAVFILILELVARFIAPTLNSGSVHIHEFPELVSEIKKQDDDVAKVLFFGNSLMRNGLDIERVRSRFDEKGIASTSKMTPVGTTVVDWTYLYKRYFESMDTHPDILIVGFASHHVADAADAYAIRNRRLGRYFLAQKDQLHAWEHEFPDFHDKVQTSLAHYSSLMGDQPEHQLTILSQLGSDYHQGLSMNNDWVNDRKSRVAQKRAKKTPKKAKSALTFKRVERFIAMLKQHGVEVWFVPMPRPSLREYDPKLIETIESSGMKWVDARDLCLDEKYFSDGYHLGEEGIPIFTRWISDKLEAHLKRK